MPVSGVDPHPHNGSEEVDRLDGPLDLVLLRITDFKFLRPHHERHRLPGPASIAEVVRRVADPDWTVPAAGSFTFPWR